MISKIALVGLFFATTSQLRAEALDGYLGLSGGLITHMTPSEQASGSTRYGARLDFVRVQKSVALDLRFGSGMDYQDMGGAFKVFHHFAFSGTTATGLSLGGGIGSMYCSGGIGDSDAAFYDLFAPVFARVIFDMGLGFGLFVDAEYNAVLKRTLVDGGSGGNAGNRYFIGAGLAITAL